MKVRTILFVIGLVATLVNIVWAQTKIKDLDGTGWTCRDSDGVIYSKLDQSHFYNIKAAKAQNEPHGPHNPNNPLEHNPICIDALNDEQISWSWPAAKQITVTRFVPETKSAACQISTAKPLFIGMPSDSGGFPFLPSGPPDDTYSGCVYDVKFKSSRGKYDPHIIIKGSNTDSLQILKNALKSDEAEVEKLKIQIDKLEKKQE